MLQFFRAPSYDFLGKRRYAYALSGLMMLVSVASLFTRGLNYGVDFRGGTEVRLRLRQAPELTALRSRLAASGLSDASLQRYGDPEENEILVRVAGAQREDHPQAVEDTSRRVIEALMGEEGRARRAAGAVDLNLMARSDLVAWVASLPAPAGMGPEELRAVGEAIAEFRDSHGGLLPGDEVLQSLPGMRPELLTALRGGAFIGDFALRSVDYVGPSVGQELRKKALLAVIGSLVGILIYLALRFEGRFGVSAVVTVAHDALFTVGMFSITQRPFDLTVVAAVLTIVGYSLNDTIVIFDRVRENLRLQRTAIALEKLMNNSVNETLSRSILTSLTVLLVVVSLYLFGGDRINDFAYAMLVGVIVGSYSTIYISCPFVLLWEAVRDRRRLRRAA